MFSWRSEVASGLQKLVAVGEALGAMPPEFEEDLKEYLAWSSGFIFGLVRAVNVADVDMEFDSVCFAVCCSLYFSVLGSNLSLRNNDLMLKQLHRLHLNYPEEVLGQLCDAEHAGDDAEAAKLALEALKKFKRDSARDALELSPGSIQMKQQVGWAGTDTMFDRLTSGIHSW